MFDKRWLDTISFSDVDIINVGNLTVGGTGKTPHVEYLMNILKDRKKAILSRGYGRKTKGVILAKDNVTPQTIGDEPSQYFNKFYPDVKVCVAERRVEGVKKIKEENPEIDVIVLDDAYQHRHLDRNVNLLLTDYNRLFYKDFMMPTGNLRESKTGAKRADAVIVTKCPANISMNKRERVKIAIRNYTEAPVFFSQIAYGEAMTINGNIEEPKDVILVTGIANSIPIYEYVNKKYCIYKHIEYADHYFYKQSDIDKIITNYPNKVIVTTEKDAVKMRGLELKNAKILYLPIEVEFFGKEFDNFVLSLIND